MTTRKALPFRPTPRAAQILADAADRCGLSRSNVLEVLVRLHAAGLRADLIPPSVLPPRAGAGRKNSKKN